MHNHMDFTYKDKQNQKNDGKDGKALYKLMKNAVNVKTIENARNKNDIRLASNKQRLFKMDIITKMYVTKNSLEKFTCNM